MRRLFFILLSIGATPAFAGIYIGNGGDAIVCQASDKNNLNGTYSLDYILTLQSAAGDDGLTPVKDWDDSANRLMKILINKVPALAQSFKEFSRLVYNGNYSQVRVWEPAPFGLIKLDDQRITSLLPENCKSADGDFNIIQAVIRQYEGFSGTKPGTFIYKYMPQILTDLNTHSPLQLSFLLVHEWLWDISSNVDRNRRVSRFLHSRQIESMSPEEVAAALKGMGLNIPNTQADAFDPDLWQGYLLTEEQFFARYSGRFVLANLGQLQIDQRERNADCGDTCNPNWKKPPFETLLQQYGFFLSPSFSPESRDYPLKIIAPDLLRKNGIPLKQGSGQIKCRFIPPVDGYNLECVFMDPDLIYPLFNLSTYELPPKQWPVMKASLTEECFRLLTRGQRENDVVGSDGTFSKQKVLTESALTVRFRWKP